MPCGFTSDFLYERLKSAEEQGSEAAGQLLREFLLHPEGGAEADGGEQEGKALAQEDKKEKLLPRITTR